MQQQPQRRRTRHIAGAALALAMTWGAGQAEANSLRELGFVDGVIVRGSRGMQEIFFPMPANPRNAEISVRINPSPMLDPLSSMTIIANDVPIGTIPVREGEANTVIPVPPALARTDFLRVRFQGDQALQRDVLCFDNDTPAVWSHIHPDTRLRVEGEGDEGVGVVWRRLVGDVPISVPASPTLQDIEAALTIAVALVNRGARPVMAPPGDPRARVVIGRGGAPLSVESAGEFARLRVADTSAARALVEAANTMRFVPSAVGAGVPLNAQLPGIDAITFNEARIGRPEINIFSEGVMEFEIPFTHIPPGKRPVGLRLIGRGPVMPPGNAISATLRVGDRIVWSETYRDSVVMDGVTLRLPAEFTQHRMRLVLRLARIGFRPACDGSFLFQLSGASQILLADGWPAPSDFSGFWVPNDRPGLVRIDVPPNEAVASIPNLALLLSRANARPYALEVTAGARLDRPFIVLSRTAPAEVEARSLLRPDLGRIVLQNERNQSRVEVSPAAGLSVIQLVSATGGVPGLWFSPGQERSLTTPAVLSSGNVAVLDGATLPAVFDTRPVAAAFEDRRDAAMPAIAAMGGASLLSQWRNELFIAAWLVLAAVVLWAILRLRRRGS